MMKKSVILSILSILAFSAAFSQQPDTIKVSSDNTRTRKEIKEREDHQEMQTILGHNQPGGGYGAFSVGYSMIDHKDAVIFGGRFEWIASHSIGFGFGGAGFINEFHFEPLLNRDVALTGGYGGLYIEPILMPRFPVHLSFPVLFGAGGISYVSKNFDNSNNLIEDSEGFLIAEPGVEIELNLTRHFRFTLGATYRFPTAFDVGTTGTSIANAESIKGISYLATFKFGRF